MPRLFTGIEVPEEAGERLAELRGGLPGARWIDPIDYHVTLRFIGDVDRTVAREVDDILSDMMRRPLEIVIDALGSFGGARPRSLFARVEPTPELVELQADQERRIRKAGLPPERRKFTPHVTLARLGNSSPLDLADYFSVRGAFRPLRFTADRIVLYSSRDSIGGGPYMIEAAYPLG